MSIDVMKPNTVELMGVKKLLTFQDENSPNFFETKIIFPLR